MFLSRELTFLAAVLIMGIAGRNRLVILATTLLILVYVSRFQRMLPLLERWGLEVGLVLLIAAVMAPLISNGVGILDVFRAVRTAPGAAAVVAGVLSAYLGARGVDILRTTPEVIVGLIVGTIIGVAFLRGVPVGPLIAAGMAALVLDLFGARR
ncbi:MAG: DUF441 domain-containing protein [Firmicutes bacterium]|nr:DUF441 domain-containing protein [Bacillota bacterium]